MYCDVDDVRELVLKMSNIKPLEVRPNTVIKFKKTNKFFIKMDSVASAGLIRFQLNGRYLREHRATLKVSFFGPQTLKSHLSKL